MTILERTLGLFIWFGYRIPIPQRTRLIKESGFKTVLHWWDDSFIDLERYTKEEQSELIRKEGLTIEHAHLQFSHVNHLWLDTQDGQAVFDSYLLDIDGLANYEIPVAVMHMTTGQNPPNISDIGMYRMRTLVERAEKCGVKIAIENVSNSQMLNHVLDTIESPMLGLCYDSGHDYIWSPTPYIILEKYKDRLFAIHLHDNIGENDDHLAPGEGKVNWGIARAGIESSVYTGSFTLEIDTTKTLASRTPQEHLMLCYKSAVSVLS